MNRHRHSLLALLALICLPFFSSSARSDDYVWLEAEQYDSCNFEHFERSSMGKPDLLSGGEWLMRGINPDEVAELVPDEGIELTYTFEVPAPGSYQLWARVGWYSARPGFRWRVNEGPWSKVPSDYPTTNLMEMGFFCEASWANLGTVDLEQGTATLELVYPKVDGEQEKMLVALDCLALVSGPFAPEGPLKPGETYDGKRDKLAAEQVYALPAPDGLKRQEVTLNGLWQVARYDDPNMDENTYDFVRALPEPDEYPLRWMGFDVPGSPWDHPPLVFGHRLIYRTHVDIPEEHSGRGFKLHFSGTNWIVSIFVNGQLAGTHRGVWVPWDLDISEHIRPGEVNELAVAVKGSYYAFDADAMGDDQTLEKLKNRPLSRKQWTRWVAPINPSTKGDGDGYIYGIVNPVTLVSVGNTYTEDVFIKTSVERTSLSLDYSLRNTTAQPRKTSLRVEAVHDATDEVERVWEVPATTLPARTAVTRNVTDLTWKNPKLWWPEPDPDLYRLRTTVLVDGEVTDVHEELFGFREVTIRDTGIYINGKRRNFWCWVNVHENWIESPEQWLHAFREGGNRFTRFSQNRRISRVYPSREKRLEFYDRNGIPGRLCTMIDGMRISYHLGERTQDEEGDPLLIPNHLVWQNFRRHMEQVAKAYRNHPSIIFYQVENELVYINGMNIYGAYLDRIETLMNDVCEAGKSLDPTRPYTVGGGGDLSGRLEVNCPHYPLATYDHYPENAYTLDHYSTKIERWPWERDKPWIAGESCFANHLQYGALAIGGDVHRGHNFARRGKAKFLRAVYGGYRWAGVAGFFPWDNLQDFDDGQKVFAPLAAIPRKQTHRLYGGRNNRLLFKVMNDTLSDEPVTLGWEYRVGNRVIASDEKTWPIEPGCGREHEIRLQAPSTETRQEGTLTLRVTQRGSEEYIDRRDVPILPTVDQLSINKPVYVLDRQGNVADWLKRANVPFERLNHLKDLEGAGGLLIIGGDTLTPEEAFGPSVLAFAARGGSVICLEQDHPLAGAALPVALSPTPRFGGFAHPEALGMPIFRDLGREDLIDWSGDHPTYKQVYRKPAGGARALASAGARLQFSPLVEVPCGQGVLALCQLRIATKLGVDPAADILLRNLIDVYGSYEPAEGTAAVYLPESPLAREKLGATGLLLNGVASVSEALDPDHFRVAILEANASTFAAVGEMTAAVKGFQDAGGWIMHG